MLAFEFVFVLMCRMFRFEEVRVNKGVVVVIIAVMLMHERRNNQCKEHGADGKKRFEPLHKR